MVSEETKRCRSRMSAANMQVIIADGAFQICVLSALPCPALGSIRGDFMVESVPW